MDRHRPSCLPPDRLERPWRDFDAPALTGTVGLCETHAEAAELASRDLDVIVAASPFAAAELMERGVDHLVLEDFFDVRVFLEADEPMLILQREWADEVDNRAHAAWPALREAGLEPAGAWMFWLKGLADRLYRAAFGIGHLLLACRDARLLAFEMNHRERPPVPRYRDFLIPSKQPNGEALEALSAGYHVDVQLLKAPHRSLEAKRRRRPRDLVPAPLLDVARTVRDHGPAALARPAAGTVLHAGMYDVTALAKELRKRGIPERPLGRRLAWPLSARQPDAARTLLHDLIGEEFFSRPFRWCGADLTAAARPELEHWWHSVVPRLLESSRRSRRSFQKRRPAALIQYSPVYVEDHAALAAARSLNVPTFTYQHGGFEGNCEYSTYDLTDMRLAGHRLTYGEGVTAYLRERAARFPEPHSRLHTVGSTRLDSMRRRTTSRREARAILEVDDDDPVVHYLPSTFQPLTTWYLCRGAYLGNPYLRLLAQVAEVFSAHKEVTVIYKPFPGAVEDPALGILGTVPNVRVVDIPPTVIFRAADACVLDIPSTALLEAMLTSVPLLCHSDSRFITLREEARAPLSRRAILTETSDDFLQELDALLSRQPEQPVKDPDRGFLSLYGTHLDDGQSARRAADEVLAVIEGEERDGAA